MKDDDTDTPYEPKDGEVFFDIEMPDGKKVKAFNEELMLAKLLVDGVVFLNSRKYYCEWSKELQEETIVAFVNCSDVFAWGCADAENITMDELPDLYRLHKENPRYGSVKWCALKRNLQPQGPLIEQMKMDNAWDDVMEGLGKNDAFPAIKEQTNE